MYRDPARLYEPLDPFKEGNKKGFFGVQGFYIHPANTVTAKVKKYIITVQ